MSDGALSQSEIDALLGGMDSGPAHADAPKGNEIERKALERFFGTMVDALTANLSSFVGASASLKGPQVSFTNRDALIEQLPGNVTLVKADYNSGFPGEHIFIMSEDTAKAIAGAVNHEEDIQMDEMALSVIGEVISTLVGTQITALTKKTGNQSIASISPEATNVPKAVAALPSGNFPVAVYEMDVGKGPQQLWEVFGSSTSSDIAHALSGGSSTPRPNPAQPAGMGRPNMGGSQNMAQSTNVQSVQFPNLVPRSIPQEQGNIGLIVDVFMEMTVELGRTKKLIKEILQMGEGTIIELDKLAGEPVDILVNHKLIAKGEVVVIDENFGVRVTEIVSPTERMSELN
ncbi:flagellar motor switch protein FliN [Spirochaetia bacterium]|nr:flagellar motor switch protein FliN [Spirochaetia bacterium]GHU29507.1 flagellar motor switch protein FliN [Spirochaetia bacterium]